MNILIVSQGMIVMCPFFDDIEKLTNFKYTLPCVTRIGKEVSHHILFIFTVCVHILYLVTEVKFTGHFFFKF